MNVNACVMVVCKMKNKNIKKRYWLRGGIIIAGLALLVVLSTFYVEFPGIIYTSLFFYSAPAWMICGSSCNGIWNVLIFFIGTSLFFILGALIGWIYGKIKERKQK